MKDNIRGMGLVKKLMVKLESNSKALKRRLRAIENRLIIFYLLRDKKVLSLGSSVSHQLKHLNQQANTVDSNTVVLQNGDITSTNSGQLAEQEQEQEQEEKEDNNYLNLMYSPVSYEYDVNKEEESDESMSMVRNPKDIYGKELRLEDDIDKMADLFIQRVRQQMRLQSLNS
ncbi:Hypothetical predicted protein [Olea europaea subsp. europaea]|uniref:Uncharacterized protein n=1 Tax=Olea europaea subsp. europaea TaxID=158383 RepID=A0A8S0RY25_OLEEU|nr:Hypothetical predicted protein [Olea europaea subsp. europaea]